MVIQLLQTCVLGQKGVLLNLPVSRAHDLIRADIAVEYDFKVVKPESKEQPKKRGRPKKDENALFVKAGEAEVPGE
jgi:hypothetical protein